MLTDKHYYGSSTLIMPTLKYRNSKVKPYAQHDTRKQEQNIELLSKLRHYVPQTILRTLHFAFMQPHIDYA